MTLYDKIKKLCEAKGISISECEKRAGIGNGVIAGWKASDPQLSKIYAVAKVLEVPITNFLEG